MSSQMWMTHYSTKSLVVTDSTCTQYCRRSALYKLLCMYVVSRLPSSRGKSVLNLATALEWHLTAFCWKREKSRYKCCSKSVVQCRVTRRSTVTDRCLVSLSHSRLFETAPLSTACVSTYSVLVFHCNYVSILYRFWDIQHQIMVWPWILALGSFKVTESGTSR